MGYDDFVVLLARQRSGTNALRSVLESHPDIVCFNEVFNIGDKDATDAFVRDTNFFNFLVRHVKGDLVKVLPGKHEDLFLDFLEYLRCFSPKRFKIIDVKYNTVHVLSEPWQSIGSHYLLDLIMRHGLSVLNVTRRHYLRCHLSVMKAWRSNNYSLSVGDGSYCDRPVRFAPRYLLRQLETYRAEEQAVQETFRGYKGYLTTDYVDVFPATGGGVSRAFLASFAAWLGLADTFSDRPTYRKLSHLSLRETIANYDEIERILRGTAFEYCLTDEPLYSAPRWPLKEGPRCAAVRTGEAPPPAEAPAQQAPAPENDQSYAWLDATHLRGLVGCPSETFCDALRDRRPTWAVGSLSHSDTRFLFSKALGLCPQIAVELGAGSGFSAAVLCHALSCASRAKRISGDFRIVSYDSSGEYYADPQRQVGDAARELLSAELMSHVSFYYPAWAADIPSRHGNCSICLLFIDADHRHPWPTLDLLAVLESLSPGACVIFHDINLPFTDMPSPAFGAKYVFDELNVVKEVPRDCRVPNIGSIMIPEEKSDLKAQLERTLFAHEWQVKVDSGYLDRIGVNMTARRLVPVRPGCKCK